MSCGKCGLLATERGILMSMGGGSEASRNDLFPSFLVKGSMSHLPLFNLLSEGAKTHRNEELKN